MTVRGLIKQLIERGQLDQKVLVNVPGGKPLEIEGVLTKSDNEPALIYTKE